MHKQFYGFAEEPFPINQDNDFWYPTRNNNEVLTSMMSAIKDRKGIVLITGEEGTGKTILLRKLLEMLDRSVTTILISRPSESFEEMLREILRDLELPPEGPDKSSMLSQFLEFLDRELSKDETVLIAVDQAHEISGQVLEELRILCNSRQGSPGSRSVQVILVGRPELEEKLRSRELRQLQQRVVVRCRLQPLSEIEIQQYVEHRLQKVGRSMADIFTPDAVDLIGKYSQGIPRSINMLCYMAICGGYVMSRKKIGPDLVEKVFPVVGTRRPGRRKGVAGSAKGLVDHFEKSPLITKITYILFIYSFLTLFIVFWLNLLY